MSAYTAPRRRRGHSPTVVRRPEQLQQRGQRRQVSPAQVFGGVAVGVICAALIALIWLNTGREIRHQADDQRARVEAALTAQATTLAMQAQHELLMIDQSLAVLQAAWNENPDAFRLDEWQKKMSALTAVADDVFIANQQHIIVQDTTPAAIGQGVGSPYGNFANGSLEPLRPDKSAGNNTDMLIGELGNGAVIREYTMYMMRPLLKPAGWLVGASYRSRALTDVFATAGLGRGGFAALIDTHRGGVQALAGSAAVRPAMTISNSPMYHAMVARPDGGIWVGTTPIDHVDRIIAFHRVPDRDLVVLVGETTSVAMAPAEFWASAANWLAAIASLLVAAIGATVLWEMWHWRRIRRRQRALQQTQALLAGAQAELGGLRTRAAAGETQVQALLGLTPTGVATLDSEYRLRRWNKRFAAATGLPPAEPHEPLPLRELVRRQAQATQTDAPAAVEAEVARLLGVLLPEGGSGQLAWTAPDGTVCMLRSQVLPDGGRLLTLQTPAEMLAREADAAAPEANAPVEWS